MNQTFPQIVVLHNLAYPSRLEQCGHPEPRPGFTTDGQFELAVMDL
jgi:hypothetical protein